MPSVGMQTQHTAVVVGVVAHQLESKLPLLRQPLLLLHSTTTCLVLDIALTPLCCVLADVAESIGRELLVYGRRIPKAEMFARIDAVDADTVRAVADRFIYDQDVAIAAVGDTQVGCKRGGLPSDICFWGEGAGAGIASLCCG